MWRRFLILLFVSACNGGALSKDGGVAADADATSDATSDGRVDASGSMDALGAADVAVVTDTASGNDGPATVAECEARTEQTCKRDNRCRVLSAWSLEAYCANDVSQIYTDCIPALTVCGQAITWGTDPATGRMLVFSCTRVPAGWTSAGFEGCPSPDAGVDAQDH
ncbi:MAG: hypothetical protein JWM82_2625 [Myxococcales bacterium]|nr:hypothetical protein [Myxococcales bacterium]